MAIIAPIISSSIIVSLPFAFPSKGQILGHLSRAVIESEFPSVLVPLIDPKATADINPGAVGIRKKNFSRDLKQLILDVSCRLLAIQRLGFFFST